MTYDQSLTELRAALDHHEKTPPNLIGFCAKEVSYNDRAEGCSRDEPD